MGYTKATFGELIGKVMQLSGGTFREDVVEVLAGDSFGAVYLLHHFERDGKAVAYHTIHLWRAREGRLAEWREYPQTCMPSTRPGYRQITTAVTPSRTPPSGNRSQQTPRSGD